MGEYYDEKNKETFDYNTQKIWEALVAIKNDKKLPATKAQLVKLTGLTRNTFNPKGVRSWVGGELDNIKSDRISDAEKMKVTKQKETQNLNDLLDQSKLEILHWFTKYSESERELEKLRTRSKRDLESLEWYKAELQKEREAQIKLHKRIEVMESLLNDKLADSGA
ncbi:hypothetical protein [Vibrio diazotrophicus]|uniref:Uncharacterized protein n=1 Tax=Vibrio diazotrophicus TaxID=685 RepID=A0ABX4WBE7_VIBDI|nr:hypothetical protein [Vibrio diazotrophicus]PNI01214.1 hypothetical protein C1O25_08250 [Vibrio diazotrophicus]